MFEKCVGGTSVWLKIQGPRRTTTKKKKNENGASLIYLILVTLDRSGIKRREEIGSIWVRGREVLSLSFKKQEKDATKPTSLTLIFPLIVGNLGENQPRNLLYNQYMGLTRSR